MSLGLSFSEEHLALKSLQKTNLEEELIYFHNLLHILIKFYISPELPKDCDALEMLQRNISAIFCLILFLLMSMDWMEKKLPPRSVPIKVV